LPGQGYIQFFQYNLQKPILKKTILTQDRSGKSMANAITAIKTKAFIRVVIDQNHGSAAMQFLIKKQTI
jgi:hypothetical protein